MRKRSFGLLVTLLLATATACGGDDEGGGSGTGGSGTGGAAGAAGAAGAGGSGATGGAAGGGGTAGMGGAAGTGGAAGSGGSAGATGGTGGATGGTGGATGGTGGATGGTGGATGGTGGATGGTGGATGGTGGATGGTGGATGGTGGGSAFWTNAYNPNGNPNPTSGKHQPGANCGQCHTAGGPGPQWMFGGTVYKADKTTPAPHVEVGVKVGTTLYSAYTATNGNFWVAGTGTITWSSATVKIRNANGEKTMTSAASAWCNSCHGASGTPGRITEP